MIQLGFFTLTMFFYLSLFFFINKFITFVSAGFQEDYYSYCERLNINRNENLFLEVIKTVSSKFFLYVVFFVLFGFVLFKSAPNEIMDNSFVLAFFPLLFIYILTLLTKFGELMVALWNVFTKRSLASSVKFLLHSFVIIIYSLWFFSIPFVNDLIDPNTSNQIDFSTYFGLIFCSLFALFYIFTQYSTRETTE